MAYSAPYTSEMQTFADDFWYQITKTERHIDQFLSFYPQWESTRKHTINFIEKLLEEFTDEENACDTVRAFSSSVTFVGKAANSAREEKSDFLKAVSLIGQGISFLSTTAREFAIDNAKEKLKSIIAEDYSLTKRFVKMGLDCQRLLNRTKIMGDKMKKMDWSSASELIEKEMRKGKSPYGRSCVSSSSSNMSSIIADIVETTENVSFLNILSTLRTYLDDNPAVKNTCRNAVQLIPDIASILSDSDARGMNSLVCRSNFESMNKDCHDVSESIQRLASGTSETQSSIRDTLKSLNDEYDMLKNTYVKLSEFRKKDLSRRRYPILE